jgi:DNA gyrase subunit A
MSSNDWNKAYKKSARIVGDVIGKYPHGDTAVYNDRAHGADFPALSADAAGQPIGGRRQRRGHAYTESACEDRRLLAGLDKETVDRPNYDGSENELLVLPQVSQSSSNGRQSRRHGHQHPAAQPGRDRLMHGAPEGPVHRDLEDRSRARFPDGGIICGVAKSRRDTLTGRGRVYARVRTWCIRATARRSSSTSRPTR